VAELIQITKVTDKLIGELADLMLATFADPNIILSDNRIREFLTAQQSRSRTFHVLTLVDGDRLVGGTIFSYMPESNCGFSEYMVLHRDYRGKGLGRQLFAGRKAVLDEQARLHGLSGAYGLFIEVENPTRTPQEYIEQERVTAMDAVDRWRVWHRMGFYRTALPYVQPPLGPGKEPIYYMDLLFAPWDPGALASGRIPRKWVLGTVTPIWQGWAPDSYQTFLDWLDKRLEGPTVALMPLFGA
jgi:GNAT superfamily N-acetyltransferase